MLDSTAVLYTRYEADFAAWAIAEGWKVTKRGWPDFICRRSGEVMAVEVKGGNDGLSSPQHAAICDLRALGMPTYVWTPETGLRDVVGTGPVAESIHSLREENAKLRALLAEVVGLSMRMDAVPGEPLRRLRWGDEEARALGEVATYCRAQHWRENHSNRKDQMSLCVWLAKLHGEMTSAEIAEIVKEPEWLVKNLTKAAMKQVERAFQQQSARLDPSQWFVSPRRR